MNFPTPDQRGQRAGSAPDTDDRAARRRRSAGSRLVWLGKALLFVLSLGMLFPQVFWEDDD